MTSPPLDSRHGQQRRAWHDIFAFGQHTRSDVRRGMSSAPLDNTHSRTTSGVACHHSPWTANTVKRRQAWHAIIAFGQHKRSDGIRRCMLSSALASTHIRTTLGVTLHHHTLNTRTVGRRRAWHDIIPLGQHTRLATSGVARHHRPWTAHMVGNVGRGMTSPPLDNTHRRQRRVWHDITFLGQHTQLVM